MKTLAEIEAKAKELTASLGIEVTPICFEPTPGDQVIGYLKSPDYNTRAYAFEKTISGSVMDGAEAIFFKCIIKEESDPRLMSETEDVLKYSAVTQCIHYVKGYDNQLKKK